MTTAIHPGIDAPVAFPISPSASSTMNRPRQLDREVENDRQHTRPERCEAQLEHDRLGCDDAGMLGAGAM